MMRGVVVAMAVVAAFSAVAEPPLVRFQSHRGGMNEVPENTLVALEHSWGIPGAVPEVDLRTTSDGVIVCLHDRTPERTTTVTSPDAERGVETFTLEEVRAWDAGAKFDPRHAGTRVPTLEDVFEQMRGKPEREINLDLKAVELEAVVALIDKHGLREQVWWVHGSPAMCEKLSGLWPGSRVMTWISDPPEVLKRRFEKMREQDFHGVKLLQFHLHAASAGPPIVYALDDAYLASVIETLSAKGIALQVRPFEFDAESLGRLIDLGIHWYVTDDPKAFREAIVEAQSETGER